MKVQSKPTKNEKVYTYLRNVSWEETDSENEHTTVNSPTLLDKKGYLNSTDSDLNRIDCTTDFGTFDYRDFEDISFTEPFINMKRKKIDDDTNHLTMNNKNHFPVEQQISKVTQKITENIEKIEFRSITPSKPHINILQDIVINNPINDEKNIKHQSEKFQSDTNFSFPENSVKLINQNVTQLDTQQFVTQQQWNMIASNNENGFITSDVNLPNVGSHYPTCSQVAEAVPKEQMALPTTQPQNIRHPIESKTLCPFCLEEVGHFSRHLFSKHSDEGEIKQILKLPLKSNERRDAIRALRKKGDFITNQKTNEIRVVRKPNTNNSEVLRNQDDINFNREEYVPCVHCLGYYKKNYLWRHAKNCKSKNPCSNSRTKIQHLSVAQTFLVSTGLLGNFLEKSRLKQEVLNIMRPDDISLAAKGDALICIYGESYLNKHKRKQMNVVVSNKMRELARLKLTIQKSTAINSLIEILKPEMYNQIVAATKIISGYNAENRSFSASSLALHLGTNLKFLCDIARKAIITKDPLFPMIDEHRSRVQEEILQLREMIKNHWCNDISSLANKVLNEVKWEKPKLLPLTEDVLLFKNFVTAQADESYANLMNDVNLLENYKLLAESTLCMILVFNRKRIGEVQFLDIDSYYRNHSAIIQQESFVALTEVEKTMCSNFKRILVFGKGSKPVPLLLTNQMQKYVEKILEIRKTKNIVPSNNRYIFANPESNKWMCASSVLRKFAKKCGAKKPELLTSTKFRKQIATILQLMSFEKSEMEQIARFMGHTEKTHLEFYRYANITQLFLFFI